MGRWRSSQLQERIEHIKRVIVIFFSLFGGQCRYDFINMCSGSSCGYTPARYFALFRTIACSHGHESNEGHEIDEGHSVWQGERGNGGKGGRDGERQDYEIVEQLVWKKLLEAL